MKHRMRTSVTVCMFVTSILIISCLLPNGLSAQIVMDQHGEALPMDSIQFINRETEALLRGGGGGAFCANSGIFNVFFSDVQSNSGSGFDDATLGVARRDAVCRAFTDLSLMLQPAEDPYELQPNPQPFVNITIFSAGLPSGALAAAQVWHHTVALPDLDNSPLNNITIASQRQSVLDGEVWRTINGGRDSWEAYELAENNGQNYEHGRITVNFDNTFHLDPSTTSMSGYDLYRIILHEAYHLLGFYSNATSVANSIFQSNPNPSMWSTYFSRYDLFLNNSSQSLIIDQNACVWDNNTNSISTTTACDLFFTGNWTSTPQTVFSPSSWMPGSSLSHLDNTCMLGDYLMHWSTPVNVRLIPSQTEVNMLCDIGYHTESQFGNPGSGWDDAYATLSSCGDRLAGVDDIYEEYATRSFYTMQQGGSKVMDTFLDNDEDETSMSGTPTSFDCLTILQGGGSFTLPNNTSFSYSPDPEFIGWAILRYVPVNSTQDKNGNLTYIYIEVRPEDICVSSICSIVNGGDFEGSTMSTVESAPYHNWRLASRNSPDLIMYDVNTNSWISERFNFDPWPWTWPWVMYYGNCPGPPTNIMLSPSHNGFLENTKYMAMVGTGTGFPSINSESLMFELCRPLIPGNTYSLDYWLRGSGNCDHGVAFDGSESRPCNQAQGATTLGGANACGGNTFTTTNIQPPVVAPPSDWTNIQYTFVYSGTSQADWLLCYMANQGGYIGGGSIFIDDILIQPQITTTATITPSCNDQNDGAIALDVHYYPDSYTILWSNSATTATITDLAPGTYTVTITDTELGCATLVEEFVVGDADCDGPFSIAKWVNPNNPPNTYAGGPMMYTIQVCNNDVVPHDVDITDELPLGFVPAFNSPNNPYWPAATVTIPAGQCITTEITGFFTQIGTHTNTVLLEQDPISLTAEAEITVLDGCPMIVYGNGPCEVDGTVDMCLGLHTQLTDVEQVSYYIVYPNFLVPPSPGTIASPVITSPFSITSATIGTPEPVLGGWPPDYLAVPVIVNFPSVNPFPPYWLLCLEFTVGPSGVPAGINSMNTWASTSASTTGWNRVTVTMNGDPVDLWTQAYHILFTGCEGIDPPDAGFTVDVPDCGGAVTVDADLSDPEAIHIWTWGDERTTPINGAQSWTYDYFEPITDNQGWPVNIPPADPGTYTITHTVILDGVASSSSTNITIYPCCMDCCEADEEIFDGMYASAMSGDVLLNTTVDIQGVFVVDVDFVIEGCQVYMEPGAEIIVKAGAIFDLDNSTMESCQDVMWKSITVENGGTVRIRDSYVDDAESAIVGLDGSVIWLVDNQFHNNRVAVHVPAMDLVPWNDVVVYAADNLFYSMGPLAAPYATQTSDVGSVGFAALVVHNMELDFTGGGNYIYNLSNGIVAHQSDVSISGCGFIQIQPDPAYTQTGNGSAIYANGFGGWYTVKQYGFGMSGGPTFYDCRWGIYASYMNVYSRENVMQDMGTAYRVGRSGYRHVHIYENMVHTRFNAIELLSNDGAAEILVEHNDITFGGAVCDPCPEYSAIRVSEGGMANPASMIKGNVIHFLPTAGSRHGITLVSADDYRVVENVLDIVDNTENRTGISTSGCRRTELSCNTIVSSDTGFPVDQQSAIRNSMGSDMLISCNSVHGTTNGILFNGWAYGTDLRGNNFGSHKWGLHLDGSAIIGIQSLKGNLWHLPAAAGGWGAWYENPILAFPFRFFYSPATILGGSTTPPSRNPSYWFVSLPGLTNYTCSDGTTDYCDQFYPEPEPEYLLEIDQKIASDSLENDPYTEETKWVMKGDLYRKLDASPELLDADPLFADFHADLQGSLIENFKLLDDAQLSPFVIDSVVADQVHQN